MKVAVLFSGGKDSCLALFKTMQKHEVACLVSIISENPESYMFHTPNIHIVKMQAEAIGIPLFLRKTKGEKEKELDDLKAALQEAKKEYQIEGIVTGAIKSVYQSGRIQKICDELGLECINPLWQRDEIELLNELVKNKFKVIITKIAAEGFDESWLRREIDKGVIKELGDLQKKYGISIVFEGGEGETLVTNAPFFKKEIKIIKADKVVEGKYSGYLDIKEARLEEKD